MQLFLLTSLTMIAFAANSVLNRMALASGGIDAASFGALRVLAGVAMLGFLVAMRGNLRAATRRGGAVPVLALFAYMFGFSFAYLALDAGLGALILFGVVQITMFAGAVLARDAIPARRWVGAVIAFGGLVWLLWPGQGARFAVDPLSAALMTAAGVGWGVYSLAGRGQSDPLAETFANFLKAAPLGLAVLGVAGLSAVINISASGAILAVLSGAVTSGLGYALWYRVLPLLAPSIASVAQLTVPVIAMAGGWLLLGETLRPETIAPALCVLIGVGVSVLPRRSASV